MDDRVDGIIREWHERRPKLDLSPLEVVARVIRVLALPSSEIGWHRRGLRSEPYRRSRRSHRSRPGRPAPSTNTVRAGRDPPPHHGGYDRPSQPSAKSRARRTPPQPSRRPWCPGAPDPHRERVGRRCAGHTSRYPSGQPWNAPSVGAGRPGRSAPNPPPRSRRHPGISTRHRGATRTKLDRYRTRIDPGSVSVGFSPRPPPRGGWSRHRPGSAPNRGGEWCRPWSKPRHPC